MGATSSSTQIGLATQGSGHGTSPAASYADLVLTEAKAAPRITIDPGGDEFGIGGLVATDAGQRLGIYTPISGAGRIRAGASLLGLLYGAGLATVATTGTAPALTHTLTLAANDSAFPWSAFRHSVATGANNLIRILSDARIQRLEIVADRNDTPTLSWQALAGHEQIATGIERTASESRPPLTSVRGSITFNKSGGGAIAGNIRRATVTLAHDFPAPEDEIAVGDTEASWITWLGVLVDGEVDAAFDRDTFLDLVYGGVGTAGAGYDPDDVEGTLTLVLQSGGDIPGTATPYGLSITIPNLVARLGEWRSAGRNEIRLPIVWQAYQSGADNLIEYAVTTDQATVTRAISAGTWSGAGLTYTARSA